MSERPSRLASSSSSWPPSLRVKVVPASFGLDGFEDAVWEAADDALLFGRRLLPVGATVSTTTTMTLVVAAPDLFTDPALLSDDDRGGGGGGGGPSMRPRLSSPQAEFESDRFREFASDLEGRLEEYSRLVARGGGGGGGGGGGLPTTSSSSSLSATSWSDDEEVQFATFHPLWRSDGKAGGSGSFPYPCFAVSSTIEA